MFFTLLSPASRYKTGFFTQLRWLLWRSSIDTFRNPFEFRLRIILSLVIGVLFGLLFLRLHYDQQAFQNISAVIFILIINSTFANVQSSADVNPLSKERIKRQTMILCFAILELQPPAALVLQRTRWWDLSDSTVLFREVRLGSTHLCSDDIHHCNYRLLDDQLIQPSQAVFHPPRNSHFMRLRFTVGG